MKNFFTIVGLMTLLLLPGTIFSQVTEGEIELYKAMLEQDRN